MAERELEWEANAPVGHHIAVQQTGGLWRGIPRFAIMALIEDPRRPDKVVPVALEDVLVNRKPGQLEIRLMCPCRQPDCTAHWSLKGTRRGNHPQRFGAGVESLARSILKK
jgi:hypothetical protein